MLSISLAWKAKDFLLRRFGAPALAVSVFLFGQLTLEAFIDAAQFKHFGFEMLKGQSHFFIRFRSRSSFMRGERGCRPHVQRSRVFAGLGGCVTARDVFQSHKSQRCCFTGLKRLTMRSRSLLLTRRANSPQQGWKIFPSGKFVKIDIFFL